ITVDLLVGRHIDQRDQPEAGYSSVVLDKIGIEAHDRRFGPNRPQLESTDAVAVLDDRFSDRPLLLLVYPFSRENAPGLPEQLGGRRVRQPLELGIGIYDQLTASKF